MRMLVLVCFVLLALLVAAWHPSFAASEEDPGITDVRVSACHFMQSVAEATHYTVQSCRIDGEVVYRHGGRAAIVPVKIKVDGRWANTNVWMEKSLWYGSAIAAR